VAVTARVRAQAIRRYRLLVDDLGVTPNRFLRKAGINASALDQAPAFISFGGMIRPWAATVSGRDDLEEACHDRR
jgi:hypothetical protein